MPSIWEMNKLDYLKALGTGKILVKTIARKLISLSWSVWILAACKPVSEPVSQVEEIRDLQQQGQLLVRMAKLQIDPSKLDAYRAFLTEEIEASIAREPGVLTMYALQEKMDPTQVRVLEIYASDSAYQAHLTTEHFLKYKNATLEMVESLELLDLDPIVFGQKTN